MAKFLFFIFLLVIIFSVPCVTYGSNKNILEKSNNSRWQCEFVTVDKGYDSGIIDSQNLVIRDNPALEKLWKTHTKIRLPQPEPPYINFAEDMVIAAFRGECSTGGYTFKIDAIEREEDKIVVHLTETRPKPDDILSQALTQPYHIVKIKKLGLPVEFVYK